MTCPSVLNGLYEFIDTQMRTGIRYLRRHHNWSFAAEVLGSIATSQFQEEQISTTILMAWNPGPGNYAFCSPEEWFDHFVFPLSTGGVECAAWSVGSRKQGIQPGDTAYLYRLGNHGRGLVARGEIVSGICEEEHWGANEPSQLARYVDVDWTEALAIEDRVQLSELQQEVPEVYWRHIQGSGQDVSGSAEAIKVLWERHVDQHIDTSGGFYGDAVNNRKIERAAVRHVRASFESQGLRGSVGGKPEMWMGPDCSPH